MGLQLAQVDLNHLVVLTALIRDQVLLEGLRQLGCPRPLRGHQVLIHALVEGEDGGGGADLSTHVADGGHASGREGLSAWAMVLYNGASATLHGQDACHLEDDILVRGPLGQLAGQLHANHLGALQLPGQASHDVHRISAAYTNGSHAQAASIRGVGVRANHEEARNGIVLQYNLVDDARARLPEPHAILGTSSGKEVVHFLVGHHGVLEVSNATIAVPVALWRGSALNQVVAVDGGGNHGLGQPRGNEL
mmetsp:Transcript_11978/g.32744  ORF Transcript_11978/g.32744 Transcript_11978/m.32744 type:complete len:250 (-) Transcript_11978:514-1263(-)